jgi:hemoglobin
MMGAADVTTTQDIIRLVDGFYDRVRKDELLGPIFNDVARVDWASHLPKMYAFWSSVLLGIPGFSGNPMATHRALATRVPLTDVAFERWLTLFRQTVDDYFVGRVAEDAKVRAARIASTMQFHISADSGRPPAA